MFIHQVLFKIKKSNISIYKRDCKIWEKEAKLHKGFAAYFTLKRTNEADQYASHYVWTAESYHTKFMQKHHDRLVSLSKCPVTVLGYFNFKNI